MNEIQHLNDVIKNLDKIISLQKQLISEFSTPQKQKPNLILIKNKNE